jgi:hypothetical protein
MLYIEKNSMNEIKAHAKLLEYLLGGVKTEIARLIWRISVSNTCNSKPFKGY